MAGRSRPWPHPLLSDASGDRPTQPMAAGSDVTRFQADTR